MKSLSFISLLTINFCFALAINNCKVCNFGCASNFNAFVFKDFHGPNSVQGRVAAGGDVSFPEHTSIADRLFPDYENFTSKDWNEICLEKYGSYNDCDFCDECGKAVLVSGQTIHTSPNSRIYFGNWLGLNLSLLQYEKISYPEYATPTYYHSSIMDETQCPDLKKEMTDRITSVEKQLIDLSQALCNLNQTGCVSFQRKNSIRGNLWINFDFNYVQEVVFINGLDIVNADNLKITNFRTNSTLIFNILGADVDFGTVDLSILTDKSHHTIWNFCQAKKLNINGVVITGTILAPYADVIGGPGQINGQLLSRSFSGVTPINWFKFNRCIDLCPKFQSTGECITPQSSSTTILLPFYFGILLVILITLW